MSLHPTAAKVQERLRRSGLEIDVHELSESTRTASEAAAAVGVEVGQIVKSLVFRTESGEPVLVLCAGDRRVDTERLGDGAKPAPADEVRAVTGFAIGGVPPLGHDREVRTVFDASLRRFDLLWCAAGTPHAVFSVGTEELLAAIPKVEVQEV